MLQKEIDMLEKEKNFFREQRHDVIYLPLILGLQGTKSDTGKKNYKSVRHGASCLLSAHLFQKSMDPAVITLQPSQRTQMPKLTAPKEKKGVREGMSVFSRQPSH